MTHAWYKLSDDPNGDECVCRCCGRFSDDCHAPGCQVGIAHGALPLPCLTVRQPWAHCIAHLGKDVENRTWSTGYRGVLGIHSAATIPVGEFYDSRDWVERHIGREAGSALDMAYRFHTGAIVAVTRLVAVEATSDSPWYMPAKPGAKPVWAWALEHTVALQEPIPAKGAQRLWNLPADLWTQELRGAIEKVVAE